MSVLTAALGALGGGSGRGAATKASIAAIGGSPAVTFAFNPETVVYNITNSSRSTQGGGPMQTSSSTGSTGATPSTGGSGSSQSSQSGPARRGAAQTPRAPTPTMVFDFWLDSDTYDDSFSEIQQTKVYNAVKQLAGWCVGKVGVQETVVFSWGKGIKFHCNITGLKATYDSFTSAGVPLRAKVNVTLTAVAQSPDSQNPTSGGIAARRSRVMVSGDTLQSIAYAEYGTAGRWRMLARANGIDDPLRVRPGTALFLPAPSESSDY